MDLASNRNFKNCVLCVLEDEMKTSDNTNEEEYAMDTFNMGYDLRLCMKRCCKLR